MLIKSQDKKNIVNLNNVCHLQISERNKNITEPNVFQVDCGFVDTGLMTIGEYKSESRAIEVLGLLQNEYESCCNIDSRIAGVASYMVVKNTVFDMPQN